MFLNKLVSLHSDNMLREYNVKTGKLIAAKPIAGYSNYRCKKYT